MQPGPVAPEMISASAGSACLEQKLELVIFVVVARNVCRLSLAGAVRTGSGLRGLDLARIGATTFLTQVQVDPVSLSSSPCESQGGQNEAAIHLEI